MANFIELLLGKTNVEDDDKDFDEAIKKINRSMDEVNRHVDSLKAEVRDLKDRIARKDKKIEGLQKLLVLDDSSFMDPVTMMFNRTYYDQVLKKDIGPDHKVLKIVMRHYGPETLTLKIELAKALKLFSERYHDDIIIWDDTTFLMVYEDKKQISSRVRNRLMLTLDDIITKKDFLTIAITTMQKVEEETQRDYSSVGRALP